MVAVDPAHDRLAIRNLTAERPRLRGNEAEAALLLLQCRERFAGPAARFLIVSRTHRQGERVFKGFTGSGTLAVREQSETELHPMRGKGG